MLRIAPQDVLRDAMLRIAPQDEGIVVFGF
jgi:hypothetical protein